MDICFDFLYVKNLFVKEDIVTVLGTSTLRSDKFHENVIGTDKFDEERRRQRNIFLLRSVNCGMSTIVLLRA
eukprot:768820-Hanusia_phi.AAC.9